MTEKTKGPGMPAKALIVATLALAVGAALIAKNDSSGDVETKPADARIEMAATVQGADGPGELTVTASVSMSSTVKAIPRLVDLGAGKCIPCKLMAPILDELRDEYRGRFDVEFIDVWENPDAGGEYGVRTIPTQIFFDADGAELFRHEGFFSKEDILATWNELKIAFPETD